MCVTVGRDFVGEDFQLLRFLLIPFPSVSVLVCSFILVLVPTIAVYFSSRIYHCSLF